MADRTVTTTLKLNVREAVTDARAMKSAVHGVTEEVVDASKASDRLAGSNTVAGKATDKLGDQMQGAARDARRLDREIDELSASVRSLAMEYALLGRQDVLEKLRKQQTKLRDSLNVKKIMQGAGEDGATGFVAGFAARVGPLLARAPISPPLVAAVVAAAPLIGAALSAGIVGGVSAGTVALGVRTALRSEAVKNEADAFGEFVGETLSESFSAFRPATVGALRLARSEIRMMRGDLKEIGDESAKFVLPLTRGVTGLVRGALPGFKRGLEDAGPVVREIERGLARVGETLGAAFEMVAGGSSGAALALGDLINVANAGIMMTATTFRGLSDVYTAIRSATAIDKVGFAVEVAQGKAASAQFAAELENLRSRLSGIGEEAETGAERIKRLETAFNDLFDSEMSIDRAQIRMREGMRELTAELTRGARTLSLNSAEGRKNRTAVLDQIDVIDKMREARVKHGMTLDDANAKYQKDIAGLRRSMLQAGFTKREVDQLIGAYRRIPDRVNTKVGVTNVGPTRSELERLNTWANRVARRRNIHFTITSSGDVRVPGGGRILRGNERWGGIYQKAQEGLLRESAISPLKSPGRFMIAEPATQGELFAPKAGNMARTRANVDYAVENWWGGKVNWRPGHGGGAMAMRLTVASAGAGFGLEGALLDFVLKSIQNGKLRLRIDPSGRVVEA